MLAERLILLRPFKHLPTGETCVLSEHTFDCAYHVRGDVKGKLAIKLNNSGAI